jgi:hypothetical protein
MKLTQEKNMKQLIKDHSIKARFVKDHSLPFNVVQLPYFDYFISVFDEDYNTVQSFEYLVDVLGFCETSEDFFSLGEKLKNKIISKISSSSCYANFNSMDMSVFDIKFQNPKRNKLYIPENSGKEFVSIDLSEANFNSIRLSSLDGFDKFGNPTTFEEIINQFTSHNYFIKSKRFRQVIFGSLNPKRQRKVQRYRTNTIIQKLLKDYMDKDSIVVISDDEVIVKKEAFTLNDFFELKEWSIFPLHDCRFSLEQIGNHPYYVKKDCVGTIEIKGAPARLMPQIYKTVKEREILDLDMTFYLEGQLVRFLDKFKENE